jgi:hypothetical protein
MRNSAIGQTQPAAATDITSIKDVSGGRIEQDFAKVAPDEKKAAATGTTNKGDSGSKISQNQSAMAVQVPSTPPRTRKTAATPGKRAAESPMTAATVYVADDSDDDSYNISEQVRCNQFLCPAVVHKNIPTKFMPIFQISRIFLMRGIVWYGT